MYPLDQSRVLDPCEVLEHLHKLLLLHSLPVRKVPHKTRRLDDQALETPHPNQRRCRNPHMMFYTYISAQEAALISVLDLSVD